MNHTSIATENLATSRSPHGMSMYFNALLGHRRHFQTQSKSSRLSSATRKPARGATISHSRCQNLGMQKGERSDSWANFSQKSIPKLRKVSLASTITIVEQNNCRSQFSKHMHDVRRNVQLKDWYMPWHWQFSFWRGTGCNGSDHNWLLHLCQSCKSTRGVQLPNGTPVWAHQEWRTLLAPELSVEWL